MSNVPFNIGPLAGLIGLGSYACFTAAGIMLWLDQTRSAFAALASLVIFVIGLIMFGCSILLRASIGAAADADGEAAAGNDAPRG